MRKMYFLSCYHYMHESSFFFDGERREMDFFLLFRFLYHLFQMTMTHSSFSPPTSASWYTEDKNNGETMTNEGECSVLG